jgi:hypothetical protein
VISGEAVKTPQKMFWTEGSHAALGHPVAVPNAVAVHIIYNTGLPRYVSGPGDAGPNVNPDYTTNTFWLDSQNEFRGDNATGRVFVELVGAKNADGSVPYLGFEVVDIFSDPVPTDVNVELGTRVPGYQNGSDDSSLAVTPLQNEAQFYYSQSIPNSANVNLYATRETFNLNDFEAYWLITGVGGLQWPFLFNRYHEYWPADPGQYVNIYPALGGHGCRSRGAVYRLPGRSEQSSSLPFVERVVSHVPGPK